MKYNNLIPAIILAAAILAVGLIVRQSAQRGVGTFIADLETATQTKDADGKTSIGRIMEGLSSSVSSSMQAGFSSGQNEKTKAELAVIDQLTIKDQRIVAGQQKTQERVIGILHNGSDHTISDVNFNVTFSDAAGKLIDVSSTFSRLQGTLKPGAELGFEIKRDLGEFREEPEVLASRKAADATVSVVNLRIVE